MRLFRVELTRFRSRRAIVLLLVAAALLTGLLAASTVWETRPVSAADQARAQAQADAEAQQPYIQREIARCEKNPARYFGVGSGAPDCAENISPKSEWYLYRSVLSLAQERNDSGIAALLIVSALMIIVGTTFAGADWSSGSMSNQLLFEPRRPKVWLAKGAAVLVGTLVASAVILTAFWVTLYLVAESRGIQTGAQVQEQIRWLVGRGVVLAGLGGLGGYALTMLVRHTVGTLAALFAYVVGGEALIAALPMEGAARWSLSNNVFAWVRDGHRYFDESIRCLPGRPCNQEALLTLGGGATYLGVLLAVVAVVSVLLFRRRDIP